MKNSTQQLIAIVTWCAIWTVHAAVVCAASVDLEDPEVTIAVQSELILSDAVPAHKIDVDTENGVVTLSGSVDTYYAKLQATEAAESVKGVLAVINQIDVAPLVRADSAIRGDVITALAADPVTESFEITVTVDDGVVTLDGQVDSYPEKTVAQQVASDVPGVVDVEDELTYQIAPDRTDEDIKEDIKYRLRSDASIDSAQITVNVSDGEVTLGGNLGSAVEKTEAESEAWIVPGVESVVNDIDVHWWLDNEPLEWDGTWTDADMLEGVENALITNPRVKSFNVTTMVEDGVATLTGTVDNMRAKLAAEEEAEDVLGIWRVKNYLKVRPEVERTDAEIAQDIREALHGNPYVDRHDIMVSVYDARAYLSGEVDSWYMKEQAERLAAGVSGLIEIQNNLKVDYVFTTKTDEEIEQDIRDQLWWSPFVDSDDIVVEVHSGVATLMGTVEDWGELRSAKENAREGGATEVISKLDIDND